MQWKTIPGYEKRYEVSDDGQVKSLLHKQPRLLKLIKQSNGYLFVNLYKGTKASVKKRLVHDLVTEAFIGPKPSDMTVNHDNGNKRNNAVSNLDYMTRSDNLRHAHRTGLIDNRGENNGRAKLKERDVYTICSGVQSGQNMQDTARSYSVSVAAIWNICNGKNWLYLTSTFTGLMPSGLISI